MDLRAFLIGLGIIFKGTVEEKIKCKHQSWLTLLVAFDVFDLNGDGFVELEG